MPKKKLSGIIKKIKKQEFKKDRIPKMREKKQKTNRGYQIAMILSLAVFLGSGGTLIRNYLRDRQHAAEFEQLSELFPEEPVPWLEPSTESVSESGKEVLESEESMTEEPVISNEMKITPAEWKQWWEKAAQGRFAAYQTLKTQNSDMVGWIRIEGTKLDYPVMQTPKDPEYYIHRDFGKQKSNYGIPFMEAVSRYEEPRTSLLIYGHHMRNGAMFAALQNYTKESYFRQHPYIQFDTISKAGSYQIVSVVKVDASSNTTPWKELLFAGSEKEFDQAWEVFRKQQFYETGTELQYGDQLLALVTCEYTLKDGRLMVIAKEI